MHNIISSNVLILQGVTFGKKKRGALVTALWEEGNLSCVSLCLKKQAAPGWKSGRHFRRLLDTER